MDVAELVGRFAPAATDDYPHKAAMAVMQELKSDLGSVADTMGYLTGSGGNALQAFYRSPISAS